MSTSLRATILHFNDIHGHIDNLPWLAAAVHRVRTECRAAGHECYVVNTGDNFSGGPVSDLNSGRPVIELLNLMQVDALAVGNHDFDHGPEATAARRRESRFPWLCANAQRAAAGASPIPRFLGFQVWKTPQNFRLAVLALLAVPPATNSRNTVGWQFSNPKTEARKLVSRLRRQADLVVAITHLGLDQDRMLAAAVPELDLIVGGHSHTPLWRAERENGVPIVQAGSHGRFLGRVDLALDSASGRRQIRAALTPRASDSAEDPRARAAVDRWNARMEPLLGEVVGRAMRPLQRDGRHLRDVAMGNLITDAMRATLGAEAALCNNGSIRTGIAQGPIALRSVYAVLPFGDYWVKLSITGAQLAEVIRYSYTRDGRNQIDLQASGLTYTVWRDTSGAFVSAEIRVGGLPLDPAKTYTVAFSDYVARGGSGYPLAQMRAPRLEVSSQIDALDLADYIRRIGNIDYRPTEGRARVETLAP